MDYALFTLPIQPGRLGRARAFLDELEQKRKADYATSEERHLIERLRVPPARVRRIQYQADAAFFRPDDRVSKEADLVCSAGQLLRDYDTLVRLAQVYQRGGAGVTKRPGAHRGRWPVPVM